MHKKSNKNLIAYLIAAGTVGAASFYASGKSGIASYFVVAIVTIILSTLIYHYFSKTDSEHRKWLETRLESWNQTSYHVNTAGDEAFNKLPVGIILIDKNHVIKWTNNEATDIFQAKLSERDLNNIHKDLETNVNEGNESFIIEIYNKRFDCLFRQDSGLIYLFDQTERESIKRKYLSRQLAIGIIHLENTDQSFIYSDMQRVTELTSRYFSEIADWLEKYSAYLRNYSDQKFIFLVEYGQLQRMMEDKFEVLSKIRQLSFEEELFITARIGVACHDIDYAQLGELAQTAVEHAAKRGGDQAVVNIENEKIRYFGAKTSNTMKNTNVQSRVAAEEIDKIATNTKEAYVMGHRFTDIDAFGAMVGMTRFLESRNLNVKIVVNTEQLDPTVNKVYKNLKSEHVSLLEQIVTPQEAIKKCKEETLVVVVDTQVPKMTIEPKLLEKSKNIVVIDHHRTGEEIIEDTKISFVEPSASSSVELVTGLFQFSEKSISLSSYEATIMLAGLIVDTNNFTYRTSSKTFEIASLLKENGADALKVRLILRDNLNDHKTLATFISKVKIEHGSFGVVVGPNDFIVDRTLLAQVSDDILQIEDTDATFTVGRISADTIGISARSLDAMNVQIIMEELGGGGHFNNAAAQLKVDNVEIARERLLNILERYSKEIEDIKIILLKDIKNVGKTREIVTVQGGFGKHYIEDGLAIEATPDNIKTLKAQMDAENIKEESEKEVKTKLKEELESYTPSIYCELDSSGEIKEPVTEQDVVKALAEQFEIFIDKKKVTLGAEITSLGIYSAEITLHEEVVADMTIHILEKSE